MTTDNFCFYLQNRLVQTSQTGGKWYSDTSPFRIPCLYPTPFQGILPAQLRGRPTLKNTIASIKELTLKIAESYIGMICNVGTILVSDGEMPNSFGRGIVHWHFPPRMTIKKLLNGTAHFQIDIWWSKF